MPFLPPNQQRQSTEGSYGNLAGFKPKSVLKPKLGLNFGCELCDIAGTSLWS